MAEWEPLAETPPPKNKMLPIRKPPKTAHDLPRENCLRSCVGFAHPSRTLRAFHARNYECVPESFSPFGKRPSGFRKISPQNNFPGRPLSRPLESATPIVDGHGKWSPQNPVERS